VCRVGPTAPEKDNRTPGPACHALRCSRSASCGQCRGPRGRDLHADRCSGVQAHGFSTMDHVRRCLIKASLREAAHGAADATSWLLTRA